MDLNLESVKRMVTTSKIYHHLDCRYGGSDYREIKYEYCKGYIDATYNYNLITEEVKQILNKWNEDKLAKVK